MKWRRLWIGAASLLALGAGGFFGYMELVKAGIVRYNKWDRRERGALQQGEPAKDLTLTMYDGSPVQLSSLWKERPLFLVFGSCT
jgi:hypothetical protein